MAEKIYLQKGEEEGPTKNHRRLLGGGIIFPIDRYKKRSLLFFQKIQTPFCESDVRKFLVEISLKGHQKKRPSILDEKKGVLYLCEVGGYIKEFF
jgi:hypothetical protein